MAAAKYKGRILLGLLLSLQCGGCFGLATQSVIGLYWCLGAGAESCSSPGLLTGRNVRLMMEAASGVYGLSREFFVTNFLLFRWLGRLA